MFDPELDNHVFCDLATQPTLIPGKPRPSGHYYLFSVDRTYDDADAGLSRP